MKKRLYITALACAALLCGCSGGGEGSPAAGKSKERVRVELSGTVQVPGLTRGEGMVNPDLISPTDTEGVPPRQLSIGIMTVELDQATTPTAPQWDDETSYLDRGFFGGELPGDDPVSDGNIEYTNRDGTALQQLFYSEMGLYYYFVCVYPYEYIVDPEDIVAMRDPGTGISVYFNVDGSQDIMASTMGSGNLDYPFSGSLVFSHKLTAMRCNFLAESAMAASEDIYGDIVSVELIDQPGVIGLNVGQQALGSANEDVIFIPASSADADYPAVRPSSSAGNMALPYPLTATPAGFGYMMAMPAQKYTFRITTTERYGLNALYATYDFGPGVIPSAGTIYNLTFRMFETAGIELTAAVAQEWWLAQTFD